jgi:glycosyltransferase involved in cell wall biosynthesis
MISIVIPLFNEDENIPILAKQVEETMSAHDISWECIWVDDGSTDRSWEAILGLSKDHRAIRLAKNSGQATAIMAGIDASRSDIIVTMDADLQNDPADIPKLLDHLSSEVDVVCGFRVDRQDKLLTRKMPSRIANKLARKITKVPVTDLGCTLRVFRKDLVRNVRILGEMHRLFIVHLFLDGARIAEIPVNHRERLHGKSKYGLERFFKFISDLILAKALNYISNKPLYMFGSLSLITLVLSLISISSAFILRLVGIKNYIDTSLVSASLILFSTSLILLSIGLFTELLVRQMLFSGAKVQYRIAKVK